MIKSIINGKIQIMKHKIKIAAIILSLFFIIHEILIISDGLIDDTPPAANIAVILGSKVNKDGSLSERLKARLDKGLELFRDSLVKELYVSGGLGKEGFHEGMVMQNYLISKGIPSNLIKVDNQGINTRSTALNFVGDYPSETSAIIVTQYFHVSRCKLAFRQVGIEKVQGVHGDLFELRDPYSAFREFFGFYKYLICY